MSNNVMKQPKFTRGPWKYMRASRQNSGRIATVCRVGEFVVGPDHGTPAMADYSAHGSDEDDARLITAAPELLSALQEVIDLALYGDVDENTEALGWGAVIKDAKAAIAKATGSTP